MVPMALLSDSSWLLRECRDTRMCSADRMYVPRIGTRTSSAAPRPHCQCGARTLRRGMRRLRRGMRRGSREMVRKGIASLGGQQAGRGETFGEGPEATAAEVAGEHRDIEP